MGARSTHSSDRQLGNPEAQAAPDPKSPPAELQPCPRRPPTRPAQRGGHSGGQESRRRSPGAVAAPCARLPGLCLALIRAAADLPAARPIGALPLGHLLPPDGLLTTCLPPPAGSNRRSLVAGAPGCRRDTQNAPAQLARLGVRRGLRLLVPLGAPAGSSTFPACAGGFSAVLRSCCAVAWPR